MDDLKADLTLPTVEKIFGSVINIFNNLLMFGNTFQKIALI